jgi:hypothetical protein
VIRSIFSPPNCKNLGISRGNKVSPYLRDGGSRVQSSSIFVFSGFQNDKLLPGVVNAPSEKGLTVCYCLLSAMAQVDPDLIWIRSHYIFIVISKVPRKAKSQQPRALMTREIRASLLGYCSIPSPRLPAIFSTAFRCVLLSRVIVAKRVLERGVYSRSCPLSL